jgi:hypothetical protein
MDHILNNLRNWEQIWEKQLEDEKNGRDHEYKQHNIELLTKQLQSIRKACREIAKWV